MVPRFYCGCRIMVNQEEFKAVCCYLFPKTGKTTSFLCLAGLHLKMTGEYVMFKLTGLLPGVTGLLTL
jgi:hypothetical protein